MSDLGRHETNGREPLRLELGVFQPSALFHFHPQRGGSTLDRLLEKIMGIAERRQQPDDNKKEGK